MQSLVVSVAGACHRVVEALGLGYGRTSNEGGREGQGDEEGGLEELRTL